MEYKYKYLKKIVMLSASLFLFACSLNEGEPRVTFCQKVGHVLVNEPEIDWIGNTQETDAYSQITVNLLFNVEDSVENDKHTDRLSAICTYAYNDIAEYETLDHEYEYSPTDVFINGKMVGRYTLMKAVNKVMTKAFKGLFTE